MNEISLEYIRKHFSRICCVCLTLSENVNHLSEEINVIHNSKPTCLSIKSMIEAVTTSAVRNDEEAPSNICSMCLGHLKISFDFKETFTKSQTILTESTENHFRSNQKNTRKENETVKAENEEHATIPAPKEEQQENLTIPNPSQIEKKIAKENTSTKNAETKIKNEFGEIPQDETELATTFQCEICSKRFRNKRGLKIHVQNSHDSKFICQECGMRFSTSSNLRYHFKKHTGKNFKCDQCDKTYLTISHLKAHKKIHKNERVFLCSECGKNFNYPEALRYHMRLHTGEKNYSCNVCGLKYRMSNTLKRHMRTHTKERPFPCSFCAKRFSSMGEKKNHEMIHTGERPYKCEFCGKTCNKSWNLTTHLLSHSGQFECTFCEKSFIERKYLSLHLRKVHSVNVEEIVS